MCIIIDINAMPSVFKESTVNHEEFKPIKDWIVNGKGKLIFGGTKYKNELKRDYLKIFNELKKAGKAIPINDNIIDDKEKEVKTRLSNKDFDDQHLVALLIISKCKLICSLDKRAYPYFRNSIFFKPASNKPKIYSKACNKKLLNNQNICDLCK